MSELAKAIHAPPPPLRGLGSHIFLSASSSPGVNLGDVFSWIIGASVLILIGIMAAMYYRRRAASRDTERTLAEQGQQLDRTLAEQRELRDRTLAEQEDRRKQEASDQIEQGAEAAAAPVAEARAEQETRVQAGQLKRPKVFLCYRREDTQGFARGIYQTLAGKYGHEQVFRDIDSTPAGVRFSAWIESRVGQCSVMIVLIGDAWLTTKDQQGQRRLDSPKDWVRQEIEAALRRDIPIIPVCVQGAPMPSEDELLPSMAALAGFQSAEITDSRWDFDTGLLIQAIDNLIAPAEDK